MTKLANNWAALLDLWDKRQHQYEQCLDLHLFYRDSEQVDSWMSRQEVTGRIQQVSRTSFSPLIYHHDEYLQSHNDFLGPRLVLGTEE